MFAGLPYSYISTQTAASESDLRGETIGSYDLVFNAILNYDHLRQPVGTPAPEPTGAKAVPTVR